MATSVSDLQEALYALVINPLPTSVRNSLLLDHSFCTKLGIVPKFWFALGRGRIADADSLHNALRAAVAGKKSALLVVHDGGRKRVKLGRQRGGKATLVLKGEGFSFSDADMLAFDRRARIAAVKRGFGSRPLLAEEEEEWTAVAKERALTNRDFVELMTTLSATPEAVRNQVRKLQNLDVDTLIPDNPCYYQRLIAPLGDATSLDAFIGNELASSREKLLERHPAKALRRIAFAALWQPLIPFNLLASVTVSDVKPLLKAADPFSLLFAFELCRDRFSEDPGFVDLGRSFLEKLLLEADASTSRCNIFSALALISTNKLRQAARASNAPLFWIRFAALAHAGVLTDALSDMPDSEGFLQWATQNYYPAYSWHGVIDRRDAPRWSPDWISPDHLYAELVGRALVAVETIPEGSRPSDWMSAIETAVAKLEESPSVLAAYFAGPFDDFREALGSSSTREIFRKVEASLDATSTLGDVPELFALAYATRPSPSVVANVLRIVSLPADEPIELLPNPWTGLTWI